MTKNNSCVFSTSDDGYAVSSAVSMLAARKQHPGVDLFLIGRRFSVKTKKFLAKHSITPIEVNLDDVFYKSWDYPVECFYIFAGPEILYKRGYKYSLYVDGDVYCNNDPLDLPLKDIKDFAGTFTKNNIKALLDIDGNDSETAVKLYGNRATLEEARIQTGIVYFNNASLAKKKFLDKITAVYQDAIDNNIPRKGDDSLFALFRLAYPKWGWKDLGDRYNKTTLKHRLISQQEWLTLDEAYIHDAVFVHFTNHTKPWMNTAKFPTYTHEYFYHAWRRHAIDTLSDSELAEYYPEIHSVLSDDHLRFFWYPTTNVGDLITPYFLEKVCGVKDVKTVAITEHGIRHAEKKGKTNINMVAKIKWRTKTSVKRAIKPLVNDAVRFQGRRVLNKLRTRKPQRPVPVSVASPPRQRKIQAARYIVSTGSVIRLCGNFALVFGSGIRDAKQQVHNSMIRVVRGPLTRKRFIESGYRCPPIYGDPGLLLPRFYKPEKLEASYRLGVIPHFTEYNDTVEQYKNDTDVLVIDMACGDLEQVIDQINACEKTVSSSLHGLIISHAYGVSTRQIEYSDKIKGDGTKFLDYYSGVGLERLAPVEAHGHKYISPKELLSLRYEMLEGYDDSRLFEAMFFDENGYRPSARYPFA